MCECDHLRGILCDFHRQQAEHREGRHTDGCHEIVPLAEYRRRTEGDDD